MTLTPRVALCATFTIASLIGAVAVAQSAAAPRHEPAIVEAAYWPGAETEEKVNRLAIRQETISDLMDETLPLEAAVERFWDLSTGTEESLACLRQTIPGGTDEEKVVNQVLMFAKVHTQREPRYTARLARLQAEATSFEFKPVAVQ